MDNEKIVNEAWRLLLKCAESGLVDSGINESGEFTDEDYEKIRDRAFTMVELLRINKVPND